MAKKKHTGKIHHGNAHLKGKGGKDPHADPAHNKMNAEHGMHEGMAPQGTYSDHDEGEEEGLTGGNRCE